MDNFSMEHTILSQESVSAAFRNFEDARFKYDAAAQVVREILKVIAQLEGKNP